MLKQIMRVLSAAATTHCPPLQHYAGAVSARARVGEFCHHGAIEALSATLKKSEDGVEEVHLVLVLARHGHERVIVLRHPAATSTQTLEFAGESVSPAEK
jgi:hypothetical protein